MIFILETLCVAWFIVEFVVRFTCAPNRLKFCQDGMNLVDLAAILPYFITITLDIMIESTMGYGKILRPQMATFLRLVRILRMLRILKLSRYSRGLRILGMTLYRSARVLTLLGNVYIKNWMSRMSNEMPKKQISKIIKCLKIRIKYFVG